MSFSFSKAFSLSAIAAVSAMGVSVAQPAQALTMTRTTQAPQVVNTGFSTASLDFSGNVNANIFNNSSTTLGPAGNTVTLRGSAGGSVPQGPRINNGVLELRGNASPAVTFQFSDYLAYLSVQFLSFGPSTNPVIQLFRDNASVKSFTSADLLTFTGSGNYFNFSENAVSDRFNRVVISGTNVSVDNVAYRVPTPALLPGLVGMGVAALRKRQQEEGESA
ncbi:MAG: PTPA-CTERM sorting domain-containing protein [Nodosilinea sp. WJT8-NPBG4]|jgi:hypothetical protein|nr:PTPA-CTERM sorting domain-containing protein [Nodosilinea sp. WJT8-NPBG4]